MALLRSLSSVVRLPLHVAGKAVGIVTHVLPGSKKPESAPVPTDARPFARRVLNCAQLNCVRP